MALGKENNTQTIDNQTKKELMDMMSAALRELRRSQNERFVTAERLCEMFQIFSPSWLKTYGHLLPMGRAEVFDPATGKTHYTSRGYNVVEIQRMMENDQMRLVMVPKEECQYRASRIVGRRKAKKASN